MILFSYLMHRI